jgi:long-chain fatty acid transport protein
MPPVTMTRRALAGSAALAILAASGGASANGTLELMGAPTGSNGLSARVLGRNAETAYFNPALMVETPATTELGAFLLYLHGDIELAPRPPGVDVPAAIVDARLPNPGGTPTRLELHPLPTSALPMPRGNTDLEESTSYAVVGVVRPLLGKHLVFGFYGLLPLRGFQTARTFYSDEREQYFGNRLHFELFGDRGLVSSFSVALASQITRWFALGAGVSITTSTQTRTWVYVPDTGNQRNVLINPQIDVSTTYDPYFALTTRPIEQLRLTTTIHLPSSTDTGGENRVRFWTSDLYENGEDYVPQTYQLSQSYQPLRVGWGAAWLSDPEAPGDLGWQLGIGAVLQRWSSYRDRHGETPQDRWHNTLSMTLGGAVTPSRGRWLTGDLAFFPSPVPDQTGRTNYVDNSRLAVSLAYESPLPWYGLRLGLYVHGQMLLSRAVTKDLRAQHPVIDEVDDTSIDLATGRPIGGAAGLQTNNPGYPGFESRGYVVGAGLALRLPQ